MLRPTFASLLDFALLLIAAFFFFLCATAWRTDSQLLASGAASLKWPVTQARIVSCNVEQQTNHTKTGSYQTYKCDVVYQYSTGKNKFVGSRITYAGLADHFIKEQSIVQGLADRFAKGTVHPVRFNPSYPGDSVLLPGVDADKADLAFWKWFCTGTCILLFYFAALFARVNGDYSRNRFSLIAIPAVLLVMLAMGLQPSVIRHLVPPSAVVQQVR